MYYYVTVSTCHDVHVDDFCLLCIDQSFKQQGESSIPTHESSHMSERSLEYASALEREKECARRYDDLFCFLQSHIKDSQVLPENCLTRVYMH